MRKRTNTREEESVKDFVEFLKASIRIEQIKADRVLPAHESYIYIYIHVRECMYKRKRGDESKPICCHHIHTYKHRERK